MGVGLDGVDGWGLFFLLVVVRVWLWMRRVCVLLGLRGLLFTVSLLWHGVWASLRKPSFFKGYARFMVRADFCCQEIFSCIVITF